jgi:hypothetical protein
MHFASALADSHNDSINCGVATADTAIFRRRRCGSPG